LALSNKIIVLSTYLWSNEFTPACPFLPLNTTARLYGVFVVQNTFES